ncbi:hypothetical protein BLNAU_5303 [Blattamonas nauphoetae]|uniref:DDE-1 domain-containing protein n=1 Tax=Blattamonas nauphoetae TaxID=2049346 RepID=A0ABQ9Y802_9EUKA|nr:hypothetical protein BLNAU_5303 [Blattamonas nauphoetae]
MIVENWFENVENTSLSHPIAYLLFGHSTGAVHINSEFWDHSNCGAVQLPCSSLVVTHSKLTEANQNVLLDSDSSLSSTLLAKSSGSVISSASSPFEISLTSSAQFSVQTSTSLTLSSLIVSLPDVITQTIFLVSDGWLSLSSLDILTTAASPSSSTPLFSVSSGSLTLTDTTMLFDHRFELGSSILIEQSGGEVEMTGCEVAKVSRAAGDGSVVHCTLSSTTDRLCIDGGSFTSCSSGGKGGVIFVSCAAVVQSSNLVINSTFEDYCSCGSTETGSWSNWATTIESLSTPTHDSLLWGTDLSEQSLSDNRSVSLLAFLAEYNSSAISVGSGGKDVSGCGDTNRRCVGLDLAHSHLDGDGTHTLVVHSESSLASSISLGPHDLTISPFDDSALVSVGPSGDFVVGQSLLTLTKLGFQSDSKTRSSSLITISESGSADISQCSFSSFVLSSSALISHSAGTLKLHSSISRKEGNGGVVESSRFNEISIGTLYTLLYQTSMKLWVEKMDISEHSEESPSSEWVDLPPILPKKRGKSSPKKCKQEIRKRAEKAQKFGTIPGRMGAPPYLEVEEELVLLKMLLTLVKQNKCALYTKVRAYAFHIKSKRRFFQQEVQLPSPGWCDETSLQSKNYRPGKCIGSTDRGQHYVVQTKPMTKMTALFTVAASGRKFKTHLLFHNEYPLPRIANSLGETVTVHHTRKGWMESSIFFDLWRDELIPEISTVRGMLRDFRKRQIETDPTLGQLQDTDLRALLICDGHTSRNNLEWVSLLAQHKIDVILLPSHCSHFLQPLDAVCNREFKRNLAGIEFPKNKKDQAAIDAFLDRIVCAIEKALIRQNVQGGFAKCGLVRASPAKMLYLLRDASEETTNTCDSERKLINECIRSDEEYEELFDWKTRVYEGRTEREHAELPVETGDDLYQTVNGRRFWTTSGHVITDPIYLEKWREHNKEKKQPLRKRKQTAENESQPTVVDSQRADDSDEPDTESENEVDCIICVSDDSDFEDFYAENSVIELLQLDYIQSLHNAGFFQKAGLCFLSVFTVNIPCSRTPVICHFHCVSFVYEHHSLNKSDKTDEYWKRNTCGVSSLEKSLFLVIIMI